MGMRRGPGSRPEGTRGQPAARGQALVELAVISAILAITAFGALEFGRAFHAQLKTTQAARDGARVGAENPAATQAEIRTVALAAAEPVAPATVAVQRAPGEVTVTVTTEFDTIAPLVDEFWGGGSLVITRAATARVEGG